MAAATKEDLKKTSEQVEDLRRSNAALRAENETMERYIREHDPQDLVPLPESGSSMETGGALIERLRLRNAELRAQMQKEKRQKEEKGEAPQEVDVQMLKIKNTQLQERIDQLNQELLRLKLLSGNTQQVLSSYEKKVQIQTLESKSLSADIASRKEMLVEIQKETQQAEKERAKEEAINRKLRARQDSWRVPEVLDYIAVKVKYEQLEKSVQAWEHRVEIAERELKRLNKAWKKRCANTGAANKKI